MYTVSPVLVHDNVSTCVAINFILDPSLLMILFNALAPLIYNGSCIVVYRPVVPFQSSNLKYPVNCPVSVTCRLDTHVLPIKYPSGA